MASVGDKNNYHHEVKNHKEGKKKTIHSSQKVNSGHKFRICFW